VLAAHSKNGSEGEDIRSAALLVAVFTIIVGISGLISRDSGTTARRLYFATSTAVLSDVIRRHGLIDDRRIAARLTFLAKDNP
jgi:hypothetical protein